jgi:uncharacterized membrane protein HdeD (DUF308 family)
VLGPSASQGHPSAVTSAPIGVVLVLLGILLVIVARLYWRRIVSYNRRFVGPPRNGFQKTAEQVHRWWGMLFVAAIGVTLIINGLVAITHAVASR